MKTILFDITDVTEHRKFMSIPQYKIRLLNAFTKEEIERITLLVDNCNYEFISGLFPQFKLLCIDYSKYIFSKIPYIRRFFRKKIFKRTIDNSKCSIFFSASDSSVYTSIPLKIPKVIVIHDIKNIKQGTKHLKEIWYNMIEKSISSSNHVIAISNYTKDDLLNNFSCKKDKISVVYNSVNEIAKSCMPQKTLPDSYILWVNTLDVYKNIMTLLKAYARIANFVTQDLVIVAKVNDYWKSICLPYLKENNIESRIHVISGISDYELRYVYEHADLFVTTSTHEGFGYTPIEAAIYKCPVISTKCEALADTTQDKFIYLDSPFDDLRLSSLIQDVLSKKGDKNSLVKKADFFEQKYNVINQKNEILKILDEFS